MKLQNDPISWGDFMDIRFSFILDKNVPNGPQYSAYEHGFISQ